jgi:hypothetical protein
MTFVELSERFETPCTTCALTCQMTAAWVKSCSSTPSEWRREAQFRSTLKQRKLRGFLSFKNARCGESLKKP